MYIYATFDKPVTGERHAPGQPPETGYLRFDAATTVHDAHRHLADQRRAGPAATSTWRSSPRHASSTCATAPSALWDDKLGVIEVEGATEDQLTTLYSNLYRLYLYPNSALREHRHRGSAGLPARRAVRDQTPPSTPTHTGAPIVDGKVYVNNGFWDTYRTTWPAYSLLTPRMAGELVDGFVQQYRDGGWIARWSSPGYANLMTGTSSDVAFADAYRQGGARLRRARRLRRRR